MRFTKTLLLAAVAALTSMGCNPSDFNSVLDKAPVQELGTPGSSTGSLFVLPLPAPSDPSLKVAARMLVSRKDSNYVALADYDVNGKATLHEVDPALSYPVYSSAMRADGLMILGTPGFGGTKTPPGRVSTLSVGSKPDGSPLFVMQNGIQGGNAITRLGISVAAGSVTGAHEGDFVAVSDTSVHLLGTDPSLPIASSPDACQALQLGSATDFYAYRPVVVADLMTGGFDEIALGGQVGGVQGQVSIVQYDGTAVPPLQCPTKVLTLGPVLSFGTSLAAGDFDGDGKMDLAVGAPPDHVYIYFGPLDTATTYDVDIKAATGTQFGKQIATYYLPGQTGAQLLVADPAAPSPGGVGKVMLFNVARRAAPYVIPSTDAIATLFDSNKDADPGLFGLNLGGVQFNMGLCKPGAPVQLVPWASLGPNLMTFFDYSGGSADPRCFSQP